MLLSLLQGWGGKKESSVLGQRVRLPVHNAALMNSVMARSYEFEPSGTFPDGEGTPVHVSGTTVPVALAVAEERTAAGKDLLTALILGDDLVSRLGTASHLNVDSGWDSAGTINVLGAAAVAGKLWGLDEHQICHAPGMAINQMSGTVQNTFDYAHTFKLPQGLAAQAGVFAAALARKGFTGARDPLTGRHGYFSLRKNVRLEHFTVEYVREPRIMDIAGKIRLIPSLPAEKPLGAVVRIKTWEGKEYEKGIDVPRGMDASAPLAGAEKREKFLANVVFSRTVSPDKAEKALSLLERLEEIDNVAKILRLLVS
ncbi:MAG: MmgE/PrpD family protein [Syntrophorhabdales bacterium]|jgi:2-methylcitrate dehydratase PrpD